MRQPSALEWLAWAIHAGTDAIEERAIRDNMPFRPPAELKALAHAFVKLAQTDDFASLQDVAKQSDDGPMHHIDAVSGMVGRCRRTVETRIRHRQVGTVKVKGRTFIRAEDVDKLRDLEK